jgi:hypothetical protein
MSEAIPKKDLMKRKRQERTGRGLVKREVYIKPEDSLKLQKYVVGRLKGEYTARLV